MPRPDLPAAAFLDILPVDAPHLGGDVAVLLPVALIRRLLGKDDLKLALWKRGTGSCFLRREHVFCPEDFRHPY